MAGPLAPVWTPETVSREESDLDRPWVTVVWDDPVNLMTYVTFVLQELFGYDEATATKLMLQVHNEGKAVVSSGPRERMEHDTNRLHAYGLWATYQKDA
ncbi:ATP-dependent Clp protease adapter ClpS [Modestobacter sp. SSW1-42]|uniref:ATP-dependent Clp protease adapter ClpS n=1 Tax=Modestobacter sp. SSW1-42 TaxID=596372 RepID=UPI0039875A78